jgi:hypothetical protein
MKAIGLMSALAVLSGCGYFRPADPEPPSGTTVLANYQEPDSVLATIVRAIADKGRSNGQAAYISGFADTTADPRGYHAFFDPATVQRMEQQGVVVPPDWDHIQEDLFYSRFVRLPSVPANAEFIFRWLPDPTQGEDELGTETATLHREYQGFAITGSDQQTIAEGFVTLNFVKFSTTRWAIVRWQDREAVGADISAGEVSMGQRRLEPQSQ